MCKEYDSVEERKAEQAVVILDTRSQSSYRHFGTERLSSG